jgi:ribose transport system ATP-binding protein
MVEIARALIEPCKVLILDEPTAMLSDREVSLLFAQVRRLRATGVAVVYISHRLDELAQIADRVAVLRNGRLVALDAMQKFSSDALVKLMAGRESADTRTHAPEQHAGRTRLRVSGLSGGFVQDVSFDVGAGEIFGLAGLVGAGRTEVLRMIFGADIAEAGEISVVERETETLALDEPQPGLQPVTIRSPAAAVRHGIAFISEDRKGEGLLLSLPLAANVALGNEASVSSRGWLDRALEQALAQRFIADLRIRCYGPGQLVGALSGGNQQKVFIARWLERDCPVMLLDEPTRGIDVGAKADLYEVMRTLAARGKAIVVVSSDLLELMQICSRIGVMSAGRLAAVFERGHWSQDAMLAAAFSGHAQGAQQSTYSPKVD